MDRHLLPHPQEKNFQAGHQADGAQKTPSTAPVSSVLIMNRPIRFSILDWWNEGIEKKLFLDLHVERFHLQEYIHIRIRARCKAELSLPSQGSMIMRNEENNDWWSGIHT